MNATRERIPHLTPAGRLVLADCGQTRISFRHVQRACAKTGMRLADGAYLAKGDDGRPNNCGCPLAVLYVAREGYPVTLAESGCDWEPDADTIDSWGIEAFGLSYASGFIAGFDYTACPDAGSFGATTQRSALFCAGYRDGAAVYYRARRAELLG
jgi:hypothetical protein